MKSINQKINYTKSLDAESLLENNKVTLINETSVYKEYAILKNNTLTSDFYFDLIQIPNLRVYSGEVLKSIRFRLNLTQKEFSKRFKLSKLALYQWEHNRAAMSLSRLIKIAEYLGLNNESIYKLIKDNKILTRKSVNLVFRYEDFIEVLPFISIRSHGVLIVKQNGKEYTEKISKLFNIKIYHSTNNQFVIKNLDLYNFLITFFEIKIISKINLPKTEFIKNFRNIDLRKAIICPLLQTDGCGCLDKKKGLYFASFKNISKELHDIFVDSIYLTYGFLPSSYLLKDKLKDDKYTECYVTKFGGTDFQSTYKELIKICGSFKTSKYYTQSIEDYNKEVKPHLDYLLNAKSIEKIIALRIWASTEGAIIPMRMGEDGLIVPKLQISCSNRELLFRLQEIAESVGLHFTVRYERGIGYKCLYNMAISCALSFLKLGGFIDGVNISKSSKYYEGISKQNLLYATLEYMAKERKDASLRKLPIEDVHNLIRQIAENKELKSLDYYIKFFSKNDKVQKCLIS